MTVRGTYAMGDKERPGVLVATLPPSCAEGDARLIAAAPELLAALMEVKGFSVTEVTHCAGRKCRESHCADCNGDEYAESFVAEAGEAYRKANAAIAKATGGAP